MKSLISVGVICVILITIPVSLSILQAIDNPQVGLEPYGGKTVAIRPSCVNGTLLTIDNVATGVSTRKFLDGPSTFRYAHGKPALNIGQNQLGMAGPPQACLEWVCAGGFFGGGCFLAPVDWGRLKVYEGTSLY